MTKNEEIREVFASGRKLGLEARFFERGGKWRLDFVRETEGEREKIRERLGRHFEAVLKIVFRGRGGGARERLMAIFATLYLEGKLRAQEKVRISRGVIGASGQEAREVAEGALRELEKVDECLAKIYGEKRAVFGNRVEIVKDDGENVQGFQGEKRKELGGRTAEEWVYQEAILPALRARGGGEGNVIPQVEFRSLVEEGDERRVDFLVSTEKGRAVIEVDDATHRGREERDRERDELFRVNKIRVVRILEREVGNREKVRKKLEKALEGLFGAEGEESRVEGKEGLERKGRGFGRILVGEEEILFQEIEFFRPILSHKTRMRGAARKLRTEGVERELEWLLRYIFGFEGFREGQKEAILRILGGEDTIVLLPTGSGKSVIFQFLALIMPGVGMVVEPLRALMEDQVANLEKRGIDTATNLSGEGTQKQRKRRFRLTQEGAFSIIYVTPERMQMAEFRENMEEMKRNGVGVALVALDEAHCVSEWGHDFRVPYLNISETARRLLTFRGEKPRILALTGTASDNVLRDMEKDIGIEEEGVIQPETFDRPEIHFRVVRASSEEKMARLEEILATKPKELDRGVVFCLYKSGTSEFGVDAVFERLGEIYGEEHIVRYYGSENKAEMRENMRRFKEDEAEIMVATKAFGMGVDKGNIRYTIHFGITNSIEAFYQEAGRAGRDGKEARAYIILSNDAPERNLELLSGVSIEEVGRELRKTKREQRDDVNRVLFLHQRNYDKRGLLRETEEVLDKIGKISTEREVEKKIVAKNRFQFERMQKVLYRLKVLGVIRDWTIFDFANNEFSLLIKKFEPRTIVLSFGEYVARYQEGQKRHEMNKIRRQNYRGQKEFILTMVEMLLEFTDRVFERSRRRAILNMLELAEAGARIKNVDEQDKEIRRRILNYLGASNKELLRTIMLDKSFIHEAVEAVKRVRKKDEAKLLAETRRELESYPEHPGLILVAVGLEMMSEEVSVEQILAEIGELKAGSEKYGVGEGRLREEFLRLVQFTYARVRNEEKYRRVIEGVAGEFGEREETKRRLMEILPEKFTYLFRGEYLIENTVRRLAEVRYSERDLWTGKN